MKKKSAQKDLVKHLDTSNLTKEECLRTLTEGA